MAPLHKFGLALALYVAGVCGWQVCKKFHRAPLLEPIETVAAREPAPAAAPDPGLERRVRELEAMQNNLARQERAAQLMPESRRKAQLACLGSWSSVINTNFGYYKKLLEAARRSPNGTIGCTICDGLSYMPCVMCKDHGGKCTTCKGSGRAEGDEHCPTCLGSGECYLCSGSRKMFCPFCDDGRIDIQAPPPLQMPPAG